MRVVVMVLTLAVTACAQPSRTQTPAEITAERQFNDDFQRRNEARRASGTATPTPELDRQAAQGLAALQRDEAAAALCRARGDMAAAAPAYGGPGWGGAINAGLQQGWSAANVEAACLRAYQATGIMPAF